MYYIHIYIHIQTLVYTFPQVLTLKHITNKFYLLHVLLPAEKEVLWARMITNRKPNENSTMTDDVECVHKSQ